MSDEHKSNALPVSLLMLPDDSLMHIIDQLPMSDSISFALTCNRIHDIYQKRWQNQYEQVTLHELYTGPNKMPLWKILSFFKLFGHQIKRICIVLPTNHRQEIIENLGAYCINLKSVLFCKTFLTASEMRKILLKLTQLQFLDFLNCVFEDDCLDLHHMTQLKRLCITKNDKLTALSMDCLPISIEKLDLYKCYDLKSELLPEICKALPQLKELFIVGIDIKSNIFKDFVSGNCCDALESLSLEIRDDNVEYEAIAMLPGLKKLSLRMDKYYPKQTRQLLTMLVTHKSQQLESLKIGGDDNRGLGDPDLDAFCKLKELKELELGGCYSIYFTNNDLLRLIIACPKLHVLRLYQFENLTEKLLTDIVYEVRQQIGQKLNQRTLPIKMTVSGTKINESMFQTLDVDSKKIIDVTVNWYLLSI